MKKFGLLLAALALSTLPALSQSPFDGTWKLDTAKSHLTGDTFTYSKTASGMMHFSDGASEWDFGIDGKPYPSFSNMTTTWNKEDDHHWNSEMKIGDKVVAKGHQTLSADDKTLTIAYTQYRPDGQSDNGSTTYNRVSGGPGLAGTWKDMKATVPDDTIQVSLTSGKLHFKDIGYQTTVDGPADGSALRIEGPTVPADLTIAYKTTSNNRLDYTVKLKDKAINIGYITVSGNSMTDTSWTPGKENEKTTTVYNRQ